MASLFSPRRPFVLVAGICCVCALLLWISLVRNGTVQGSLLTYQDQQAEQVRKHVIYCYGSGRVRISEMGSKMPDLSATNSTNLKPSRPMGLVVSIIISPLIAARAGFEDRIWYAIS